MTSPFSTAVSEVGDGCVNLRGYSLEDVMRHLSYSEGSFLCIVGRLPSPTEHRLIDAVLNSLLDHGFVAATVSAARYIASGNPELIPAVAGGLLACGRNTVSPGRSYSLLAEAERLRRERSLGFADAAASILRDYLAAGQRIPGLGHPTHRSVDFRAETLFSLGDETGLSGNAIHQFREIHRQFVTTTGKDLPINVDGALAAVGWDLGLSEHQVVSFALISVLPGVMAHVIEEIAEGRPLRHITDGEYRLPPISPLPHQDGRIG